MFTKSGANCRSRFCVLVFNLEIWRKLSATRHFRLKNRAATKYSPHGAKPFFFFFFFFFFWPSRGTERCHLRVAAASRIWIHTFFISTDSIFAATVSACRAASASLCGLSRIACGKHTVGHIYVRVLVEFTFARETHTALYTRETFTGDSFLGHQILYAREI